MANNKINTRSGLDSAKRILPYVIPLMMTMSCSSPEEGGQVETQPRQEVVVAPEPKMDTVKLDFGLGELIFKDGEFKGLNTPNNIRRKKDRGVIILETGDEKIYLLGHPKKLTTEPVLQEVDGQDINFINNKLTIITDDGIAYLSEISRSDEMKETRGPAVASFVSIEDNMLSIVKDISELYIAKGKGIIFLTPDNKKIFYATNHEKGLASLMDIEDLVMEKDYITLQTKQGKIFYNGNEYIPYDEIIERKDVSSREKQFFIIKDGHIINFSTDEVNYFLEGLKAGKLITQERPKAPEKSEEKNSKSLKEALEKQPKPFSSEMIVTNVTDKFRNFKIKYIGVSEGEGTYYAFSNDGKKYYNFQKNDEGGSIIVSKSWGGMDFDEILSVNPLPKEMVISKILTGSYEAGNGSLDYLGAKNGIEQVAYTIQGASGTHVQSGAEVQSYLDRQYKYRKEAAESQGYEFLGYSVGGEDLTPTTPCPKGTKVYFRYKKVQ